MFSVIATLFAPFGFSNTKNNILKVNKVEAAGEVKLGMTLTFNNDSQIVLKIDAEFTKIENDTRQLIIINFENSSGNVGSTILVDESIDLNKNDIYSGIQKTGNKYTGTVSLTKKSGATYVYGVISQTKGVSTLLNKANTPMVSIDAAVTGSGNVNISAVSGAVKNYQNPDTLPECSIVGGRLGGDGSFSGCIAQGLYYGLFVPTSWIFGGTGKLFDYVFVYSISDSSYRSSFVTEGWRIVRDLSNIFFIFILLYVAFRLILNIGGAQSKQMIINVIIIGLLINFSLFAAQILIDASNILARVFYNSQAIQITATGDVNRGGYNTTAQSDLKEISLSAALVAKVNPQEIVQGAKNVTVIDPAGNSGTAGSSKDNPLSAGAYILVIILSTIINVVGIFVFISVSLVFVARVIGLWFAMIFAPFAFLSYTVPALQEIKMLGWKEWWSDLLHLSFIAPLFMFFLYLILLFLDKGFGDLFKQSNSGIDFVLRTMIPFIFIMVMLLKAKDLAKSMAGSMGKTITEGVTKAAVGTLGVAAGGAALGLRGTVGRGANLITKNDTVNKWASGENGQIAQFFGKGLKKISTTGAKGSFDVRKTGLGTYTAKEAGIDFDKGTKYAGLSTKNTEGGYIGKEERKVQKHEEFAKTLTVDTKKSANIETDLKAQKTKVKNTEEDVITKRKERNEATAELKIMEANIKATGKKPEKDPAYITQLQTIKTAETKLGDSEKELKEAKEKLTSIEEAKTRNKEGRQRQYYQSVRKKSGKIVTKDEVIDDYGNIKEYAEQEGKRSGAQFGKEMVAGFLKGAGTAGAIGLGLVVAGTGIPLAIVAGGAVVGGLASTIKNTLHDYSGTTNRSVGDGRDESNKK